MTGQKNYTEREWQKSPLSHLPYDSFLTLSALALRFSKVTFINGLSVIPETPRPQIDSRLSNWIHFNDGRDLA